LSNKTEPKAVPDSQEFLAQSSTWRPPLNLAKAKQPDAEVHSNDGQGAFE
jgi:hypothetical protein